MTEDDLPEVHLCDLNALLVAEWERAFEGVSKVHVAAHDITAYPVKVDAIVSPANSFGYMTGGIDAVYLRWLGMQVQENVQAAIERTRFGELNVGDTVVAETGHEAVKYCIAAPTMRYPGLVPDLHAYLAFRAVLIGVMRHNEVIDLLAQDAPTGWTYIKAILCPGLGTLTGGIPPADAANAMRSAYDQILDNLRQARSTA